MSIRQGGKVIAGNVSHYNVGDIFYTMRADNELNGAVECDGATYNTTDFTGAESIGALLAAGKVPYLSLADYATVLTTDGSVGVFGWDGVGTTTFRVPNLNDIFVETGTAAQVGDFVPAGLPNITGMFALPATYGSASSSGALIATTSGTTGSPNNINKAGDLRVEINASNSSSIYGNSTTVQPKSVRYRAMIQLFNSTTDEVVATVGGVLADVAGLKDLSNITADGKEVCANMSMPSGRYINLTLGASGSSYTAPADGYITLNLASTSTNAFAQFLTNKKVFISGSMCINGAPLRLSLQVAKSDVITVYYERGTAEAFVFSYAQGAQ